MEFARGWNNIRGAAIYALIACAALAAALYSCSQPPPPPQQQPTPLPSAAPALAPSPNSIPAFVPIPDDVPFTQIAAGKYHACGLQADGTLLCWANNISGSLELPGGNPTFSRVSAGLNFSCGLRIDGAIACWGENNDAQASPPNGRFDEVAVGRDHACALNDGALICWGKGFPDGAETIQEVPLLSAIQAGSGFTCGLTPDADMACWKNIDRELAITPGPFADIGTGLHHACAIRVDGSAFCSEEDQYRHSQRSQPPPTKFVQISGGWYHTCGITESSDIECWGSGISGATGERLSAPEGKFTAISIGWRNSCALRPNGHAVCWRQQPDIIQQNIEQLAKTQAINLTQAFGGAKFEQPTDIFTWTSGKLAVVEREGIITAYSDEPNAAPTQTILDLTDKTVSDRIESGMLSAALDPQFKELPFLYVYYNTLKEPEDNLDSPGMAGRLARFRVEDGQAVMDSALTILDVPQPGPWHYGGAVRFGADGMLYLGIGDNFSHEKAQSLNTLLGKIIRIDVRGATPKQPYRIPPDNPFAANPEALPEIWAYGLRNPWRMAFAPDGRLFVADVGGGRQEEVSLVAAGANLGWPMCEGNLCEEGVEADAHGLTAPIYTYGREDGCAIIGGVTVPWLNNGFVFGDYCGSWVRLLEEDAQEGWRARPLATVGRNIISFGLGADGTVYALIARKSITRLQPGGEE